MYYVLCTMYYVLCTMYLYYPFPIPYLLVPTITIYYLLSTPIVLVITYHLSLDIPCILYWVLGMGYGGKAHQQHQKLTFILDCLYYLWSI